RSLIMFQTFISRHNSNFFSDKLVLTSVTPASSAPVLQTPKATSSTLYFDSLTVNAGNGGFLHCIQMDTSVNAANQVVSVGADIAFDSDPKFFACLVRFDSSSVPTTLPTAYDVYPLDGRHDGGYYTVKDCVTIDVLPRTPGNNVYVGFMVWSNFFFFSSRRRHTRFDCDWSSDVCYSDLTWSRPAAPSTRPGCARTCAGGSPRTWSPRRWCRWTRSRLPPAESWTAAPSPPPRPPAAAARARSPGARWRRASRRSGRSCWAWTRWAPRTTSSTWAATRSCSSACRP